MEWGVWRLGCPVGVEGEWYGDLVGAVSYLGCLFLGR